MPGGSRSDAISSRDLEVLEFVARFGVVPRSVVASWAGTGRSVTFSRERRLRNAGLLRVTPGVGDTGRLLVCTREGLGASGRPELRPPILSLARARHEAIVAQIAAGLEREGTRVLSEREIVARERAEDERVLSAVISDGRFHRPDLVRIGADTEAIEVELTPKAATRLDEIIRAWRRAVVQGKVSSVLYLCAPATLHYVERAVKRTQVTQVEVGSL